MIKQVIQETIDTLIGNKVVVDDIVSTSYYTLLDCSQGNVHFTILFKLNSYNVTGKVDMWNTDDKNIALTLKGKHLEDGKNNILFAKNVASICRILKEVTYE